jgi:hypothetical protein
MDRRSLVKTLNVIKDGLDGLGPDVSRSVGELCATMNDLATATAMTWNPVASGEAAEQGVEE